MTKFQRMGLAFYLIAITFDAQGLAGNIGKANAAPPASNENLLLWPFPGVDGGGKP